MSIMFGSPKKQSRQKSSGAMTRELFRSLGYRIECVESLGFHGNKKDFLGFIDDIAFCDGHMIGLQSCLQNDLEVHRRKFADLVAKKEIITEWMKCCDLWLVWWTEKEKKWHPQFEILTTHKNTMNLSTKLFIVK